MVDGQRENRKRRRYGTGILEGNSHWAIAYGQSMIAEAERVFLLDDTIKNIMRAVVYGPSKYEATRV